MKNAPFSSEDEFLAAISARFPNEHPHMLLSRGDDCAIIKCPEAMALTTDLFVEDVHFRRDYFSPEDAGYKALAVNLSDIAGMGCDPLGFSLGLAGPPDTPAAYWEGILDGMSGLANSMSLPLVGGDLNACGKIVLAVTLWGKPGPSGQVLRRGRCVPGEVLFAVGEIGLAAVGLQALERYGPGAARDWPESVAAHLRPVAKVVEGLALAVRPGIRGLMDISDGLVRDLPRFVGPGLGADLALERDTLHPEVLRWAEEIGRDPAEMAVVGGEDYALLGACPQAMFLNIFANVPSVWAIGTVVNKRGVHLDGRKLQAEGFDHFSG